MCSALVLALLAGSAGPVAADTNAAPSFSPVQSILLLPENSPAGARVVSVAADDPEGDTLTYSLSSGGTDHEAFDIDGEGQITVAAGATLDYETQASYSLTVSVHDGKAADGSPDTSVDATTRVTIAVENVAEPPAVPTGVTVSRVSANSLSVSWTAPPQTPGTPAVTDYDVRYFRGGADPVVQAHWVEPGDRGGHDHVGAATSTTIAGLLDGATYVVQVQAVNADGASAWSASGRGATTATPAVTGVVLASKPRLDRDNDGENETYGRDQAIAVDVTWDRDVTWDLSAAGAGMHVRLNIGATTRMAELVTGGTATGAARTLRFRYTVAANDADADGVAVPKDADGSLVVLRSGATLQDAFGRAASRDHAGLEEQANHRVDGSKNAPLNRPPHCIAEERPGDPPLSVQPLVGTRAVVATCSDPDGDALAVSVSVDKPAVFKVVEYLPRLGRAYLEVHEACVLAAITPALPNPVLSTVTHTVTDPDGETARASGRVTTNFGSCPALLSATVNGRTLTLTYDLPLNRRSVPAPSDFVVKVDGAAVDLARTHAVAVTRSVVIVTLAAAVERDAEVTVTYGRNDTAPIQTATGTRVLSFVDHAVVNLGRPRVASVALVSTPTADVDGNGTPETYKQGDVVRARVTFTTAVDVVGSPVLTLRFVGEKAMTFDTGRSRTNTTTLEFTYTVVAPNGSPGIGFDANALSLGDGVSIRAAGGTVDANLEFAQVAHDAGHKVDGAPPRLRNSHPKLTILTSSGADNTFAIGDIVEVVAYFTETVKVTTAGAPVTGPRARLAVGRPGWAPYVRGSGTSSLVFRYTVAEGDWSRAGNLLRQNPLELNGGVIADRAGNESVPSGLAFPGAGSTHWRVDGKRPTVSGATVDRATLKLTWSEGLASNSVPAADDFAVTVAGKARSVATGGVAVAGSGVTLTLASEVNIGEAVTVSYTGDENRIRDVPGNTAADFAARTVTNVTTAEVTGVALASNAGTDNTYAPGDTVAVRVTFDRAVTVDTEDGTPRLKIDLDGAPRWAAYDAARSGATTLVFTYTVVSGDRSTRGIGVLTDTLAANGGTIRVASGTDAKLAHPSVAASVMHKVDGTGPNISATAVREATLTLTYDEALDPASKPAASAFTVKVDGTEASLAATDPVAVAGSAVTLTLAAAVSAHASVTVSYTAPADDPVQDPFGNAADGFSDRAAANATPRPVLSRATVGGDTLALFSDRNLDAASKPAASDFTVSVAGSARAVREVAFGDRYVILTLAAAVSAHASVTVSYTAGANPIRDEAGSVAANVSNLAATHNRAPSYGGDTNIRLDRTPPGTLAQLPVPASDFEDPDGDPLAFTVSAERDDVYAEGDLAYNRHKGRVFFLARWDCELFHLTPPLPANPYDAVVTLTATDPHGATAQALVTFRVWYFCPVLDSATVNGATLRLSYSETLDTNAAPAEGDFTVKVDGTAVSLAAADPVAIGDRGVTLTLAAAVSAAETVTVSYTPRTNPILALYGATATALTDEPVRNVTGDVAAPALQSAAVDGATLTLTYDEALDPASTPARSAFTVHVDGAAVSLASGSGRAPAVWVAGTAVALRLAAAVTAGRTVTVTYAPPSSGAIRDFGGNAAASLSAESVSNRSVPELQSAAVDGATLTLTYDAALDTESEPAAGAYTVTVDGSGVSLAATDPVAVTGSAVTLTLAAAVSAGQTVTVSYDPPDEDPIVSSAGIAAAGVADRAVTNTTAGPVLLRATVGSTTLVLFYDEALDTAAVPAAGDFTVTVAGSARDVIGVAFADRSVILILASAVNAGQQVTVSYTAGTNPIRDVAGSNAANLANRSAAHNRAPSFEGDPNGLGNNAVPGLFVSEEVSASDFRDPDGDSLAFTVSAERDDMYQEGTPFYHRDLGRVFVKAKDHCDLFHLEPPLPANPYDSVVTLTATDPHGATAEVTITFRTEHNCPYLERATVNGATLRLTYSEPLTTTSRPAPDDFAVEVDGRQVSLVAVGPVAIAGRRVTLTLAVPVRADQAVTVSYTAGARPIRSAAAAAADLTDEEVRNVTGDGTAPVLQSAAVDGATSRLTLTYDEALDSESEPAASAFTVTVDGTAVSLVASEPVRIRGATVVLRLNRVVRGGQRPQRLRAGDEVKVSYRVPSSDPIRDLAGNSAAGLTNEEVRNVTGDGTAPVLQSAAVDRATLTLTYDEPLDPASEPAASAYTVTVGGSGVSLAAPDAVAVAGSAVTLTLAAAVAPGAAVTVSYTAPAVDPVQDLAGNDADGLADEAVTDTTPRPALSRATVGATTLVLFYDRILDGASEPAASAFTVTVAGSGRTVSDVDVTDRSVILTLAAAVNAGDAVTVSYTAGANPIRDEAGNGAVNLSNVAATHNRAPTYGGNPNFRHDSGLAGSPAQIIVPTSGFVDPDGDPLTFTVSADRDDVYQEGGIVYNADIGYLFFHPKKSCDLEAVTPPLPDPFETVLTVTAADLHGATAQVAATYRTSRDTTPECLTLDSATVNGATLRLIYRAALNTDSYYYPEVDDFEVTVNGTAAPLAAANAVALRGRTVTLTLAAAVRAGQAVTLSYTGDSRDIQNAHSYAADLVDHPVRNVTGDSAAPVLHSAAVDGATLTLTYDEALDTESEPGPGAFTVKVAGAAVALASSGAVDVRGRAVVLTLAAAVSAGQAVTVSYAAPASGPIRDFAGNGAAGLTDEEVRNVTGDGTAPVLQSAAVDGATLTLTYDEPLDPASAPVADAYTVTVDGSEASLAATDPVAVRGSAVTLTLAAAVTADAAVTVSYAAPAVDPVQDLAGNAADGLTGRAATNTTRPALSRATVSGATLVLVYDRILDGASEPAGGDFTVTVAGSGRGVSDVDVTDRYVYLTLAAAVTAGQAVTVSYTAGANPIRDEAGNGADNLANIAVTHNRAPVYVGSRNLRHDNAAAGVVANLRVPASGFVDPDGDPLTFTVSADRDNVYHEGQAFYDEDTGFLFLELKKSCDLEAVTPPLPDPFETVLTLTAADLHGAMVQVAATYRTSRNTTPECLTLDSATVNGATLRLTYSAALLTAVRYRPDAGDFEVKVNGAAVSLAAANAVALRGRTVTLTLAAAVRAGQAVTLSYTGDDGIQNDDSYAADLADRPVRNVTGDGAGPVLHSAAVDGATLTLTYDEALDTESEPGPGAFTVKVAGAAVALASSGAVDVRGRAVVLTLAAAVSAGQAVTLSYAAPASGPIRDFAGNRADRLTDEEVRNVTGDGTAPVLQSAAVDGATLTLTYDEPLDPASAPVADAYTVTVDGSRVSLAATDPVAVRGSAVTLTLAAAVTADAVVTVSYAAPAVDPVQDLAGNAAGWLTSRAATNATRPALLRATVGGATLVLFYDRVLDGASEPAASDFTVTVAGSGRGVSDVDVTDRYVYLTLAAAVSAGQAVTVSYTAGANPIRDEAGNGAVNLSNVAATHNRAPTYGGRTNFMIEAFSGIRSQREVPASDFADPDGDPLTFTVSADRDDVYDHLSYSRDREHDLVLFQSKGACELHLLTPALPAGSFDTDVTLTATDLHGATAQVMMTFRVSYLCGIFERATVNGATLRLIYSIPMDSGSTPAPGDFEVKVNGVAVALAGTGPVAIDGNAVTLTLAAAVSADAVVTVSYTKGTMPIRYYSGHAALDLTDEPVSNVTGDGAAPLLQSAAAEGATLTLTYDEALDTESEPGPGAFTVKVAGAAVSLASSGPVRVAGAAVVLRLRAAVAAGQAVTVNYAKPTGAAAQPIQDLAGNAADDLTDQEVVNTTGDGTAPLLQGAAVDGATLTLTYDEPLDPASAPAAGAYTVTVDGSAVSLAATDPVAVTGSAVTLTLAAAVRADAAVTVSYTPPADDPVQDLAGNAAGWLTSRAATNATRPALLRATVGGATLVLFYDRVLDGASEPAASDFTVTVAGSARGVSGVDVTDRYVYLTLAAAVSAGQAVTVSYTAGANPIRDEAGNGAVNLSNVAATHNRAPTYGGGTNFMIEAFSGISSPREVPASDFADPDGDPLTFTVSADRDDVYDHLAYSRVRERDFVLFQSKDACTLHHLTPALPAGSFDTDVTLTATDLHGATAQVMMTFRVSYLCGIFERATVNGATLRLIYSIPMDSGSTPAPGDFEVKVNGVAVALAGTDPVAIDGNAVTLTLAAAVSADAVVTVSYTKGTMPIRYYTGHATLDLTDKPVSNVTGDGAAPLLQSAVAEGATLTLTYDEALDVDSVPAVSAFTVKVAGAAVSLASSGPVRVAGAEVVLRLRAAVAAGQAVTVNYAKPTGAAAQPIQDLAGNAADGLTDQEVVNTTGTPTVSRVALVSAPSVDVDGDATAETYAVGESVRARVTFSQPVDVVGSPELKLRLAADSGERSMTFDAANAVTGTTTLEFTYAVVAGDRSTAGIGFAENTLSVGAGVTIRKAGQPVDANLAFAEVAQDAGHQVDGVAPILQSATVQGTALVLSYDEGLDTGSEPAPGDYTVEVAGSEVSLADTDPVAVTGSAVTLTLAAPVAYGQAVTVSYTAGANPLRDAAGNAAADRAGEPVTNSTQAPAAPCAEATPIRIPPTDFTLVPTASTIAAGLRPHHTARRNRFDLCIEGSSTVTIVAEAWTQMHTFRNLTADTLHWVRVRSVGTGFSAWKPVRTLPASVLLSLNSAGADGIYRVGAAIEVTATFGESVTVSGAPRIAFTLGAETRHLIYASGSPGAALVFSYTVASGDEDTDGIEIAAGALENHGGSTITLTADGSTPAALDHEAVAASASHKVDAATTPDFGTATVANQNYALNVAITDLVLPAATGGDGALAYALTPALPAGLSFDAATRTLSGTPTESQAAVTYTYKVTDGDANTADSDADTLTFTIAVAYACAGSTAVGGSTVMSGGLVDDCEALLASEATLVGTGTALDWDTGTAMANWRGVTVSNARVTALDLRNNALSGSIAKELGKLSSLTNLDLRNNSLSGSIPKELGNLSSLSQLRLSENSLSGCIPSAVEALRAGASTFTINPQRNNVNLPVCPGVPVLTLTPGHARIAVSWTAPAGGTPTDYDLNYKLSSASDWTDASHTGTGTTATIDSLTIGSEYDVRVRAKTATNTGEWSETKSATPIDASVAAPVFAPAAGATVTDAGTNITLTFAEAVRKDAAGGEFGNADLAGILTLKRTDENGADIGFSATIDAAKQVITVDPTADLADGAVYVAISSGYYDAAGNQGAAASAIFTVETAPRVTRATVNGDTIELTWSETLDGGSRPGAGDFEVTVAGSTVALAGSNPVSIAGKTLTLTLASAVSAGEETVRVTYTAGSQPIRDVPGNAAASPATYTVTNNTPRPRPAFVDGNATAFTIEENAAAGTAVGTLAVADGRGSLTFVLASTGTDHQSFVIDARGRIAVAPGAVLDYETKQSYSITVSVTDGEDDRGNREPAGTETIDDTIAVTIAVANVEPPGAPKIEAKRTDQGLKAGEPLDGAIRFSWTPSASGSPATHFRVHWWQTADYAGTVAHVDVAAQTGSQNYAIGKLTNGVSYSFALKAINREGESLFVTEASAIPYTDKTIADFFSLTPIAGTGLHANRVARLLRVSAETSGSLRVQWDAPSNTANVMDGYEIAWTSSSFAHTHPQEVELGGNARSHTIANLTGGQTYRLRVTTLYRRDSHAETTFRAPAYVSGTALTGPFAVADLEVEPDDGELRLRWAPPASGGGLPLAHYEVRWGPAGGAPEGNAKVGLVQAYSVAGLTNGQQYKVEVRAVNRGTDPNAGANKALRSFEGAFAAVTASPNAPPTSSDVVKETQEEGANAKSGSKSLTLRPKKGLPTPRHHTMGR